jgi:hypothetical protein
MLDNDLGQRNDVSRFERLSFRSMLIVDANRLTGSQFGRWSALPLH